MSSTPAGQPPPTGSPLPFDDEPFSPPEPPPYGIEDFPAGAILLAKPNGKHAAPSNQAGPRIERPRPPHIWLDDAEFAPINDDYVKYLVGRRANILIYGPSGDGKTFFAFDLLAHIASGQQWRNRKTKQGLVVYVAAEAGASIVRRGVAWRDKFLNESRTGRTPFAIITKGTNLLQLGDLYILIDELQAIQNEAGMPLGIVCFDTLSRSMPGGDENSPSDMTQIIAAADYVRDQLDATTVFVHHSGKNKDLGARGHSSLYAAADTVISVIEKTATLEKSRDGMNGDRFKFGLEIINLGEDDDGDPITTCVVDPTLTVEKAKPPLKLSGAAMVTLRSLQEAIADHGEIMPGTSSIPAGARATTIERWRTQFILRYGEDGAKDQPAIKKAFQRGREALFKAQAVGISNPYAWIL